MSDFIPEMPNRIWNKKESDYIKSQTEKFLQGGGKIDYLDSGAVAECKKVHKTPSYQKIKKAKK